MFGWAEFKVLLDKMFVLKTFAVMWCVV